MRPPWFLVLYIGAFVPSTWAAAVPLPSSASASLIRAIIEVPRIDSITPSADGRVIAFRVVRRNLARNATWVQWYAVPSDGDRPPTPLGSAEAPIWIPLFDFVEDGNAAWSADGQALFVKERTDGQTQVHKIGPSGRDQAVTHDPADVETFRLDAADGLLDYQTRDSRALIASNQQNEEMSGVHFDRTVFSEGLPLEHNFGEGAHRSTIRTVAASTAQQALSGDLVRHAIRIGPANAMRSSTALQPATRDMFDAAQRTSPLVIADARVSGRAIDRGSTVRLEAQLANGAAVLCKADVCLGDSSTLREIARSPHMGEVILLHERDYSAQTGIYGWTPATGAMRTVVAPTGSIDGGSSYSVAPCPVVGKRLICTASDPQHPPRLISVDLDTGAETTLYAPLSDAATLTLLGDVGKIRLLEWKNNDGRPANGVLFLPKGAASRLPLVITTPRCRGFLHGGAGNLTPEIVLASQGIAALCVNNDNGVPLVSANDDPSGVQALSMHKAAVTSWAAVIDLLDRQGIIDRQSVGISGHSYTSMVAAYAISHTDLFAAASLGTGTTIDPMDYYLMAAPADSWRKLAFSTVGLPSPSNDPHGIWKQISPSLNASRIKAHVLIQPPEAEYLLALQLYGSIQDAGGNADMFVYPDEGHATERYPSHMAWRMSRSIDWFQQWLKGPAARIPTTAPTPLRLP